MSETPSPFARSRVAMESAYGGGPSGASSNIDSALNRGTSASLDIEPHGGERFGRRLLRAAGNRTFWYSALTAATVAGVRTLATHMVGSEASELTTVLIGSGATALKEGLTEAFKSGADKKKRITGAILSGVVVGAATAEWGRFNSSMVPDDMAAEAVKIMGTAALTGLSNFIKEGAKGAFTKDWRDISSGKTMRQAIISGVLAGAFTGVLDHFKEPVGELVKNNRWLGTGVSSGAAPAGSGEIPRPYEPPKSTDDLVAIDMPPSRPAATSPGARVEAPSPTNTPTPTATSVETSSAAGAPKVEATVTNTPTATLIPTSEAPAAVTATEAATNIPTAIPTETPAPTSTVAATATETVIPTSTATQTLEATATSVPATATSTPIATSPVIPQASEASPSPSASLTPIAESPVGPTATPATVYHPWNPWGWIVGNPPVTPTTSTVEPPVNPGGASDSGEGAAPAAQLPGGSLHGPEITSDVEDAIDTTRRFQAIEEFIQKKLNIEPGLVNPNIQQDIDTLLTANPQIVTDPNENFALFNLTYVVPNEMDTINLKAPDEYYDKLPDALNSEISSLKGLIEGRIGELVLSDPDFDTDRQRIIQSLIDDQSTDAGVRDSLIRIRDGKLLPEDPSSFTKGYGAHQLILEKFQAANPDKFKRLFDASYVLSKANSDPSNFAKPDLFRHNQDIKVPKLELMKKIYKL